MRTLLKCFFIVVITLGMLVTLSVMKTPTESIEFTERSDLKVPKVCSVDTIVNPLSEEYRNFLRWLEVDHELPEGILFAIMMRESSGRINVVSKAGAEGLFQFMPRTSESLGIDPYDPFEAGRGAATYLSYLLNYFDGRLELAIAAYNAGMGNVRRYGNNIPPFHETQTYVVAIKQKINYYNL